MPMTPMASGWYELAVGGVVPGALYNFILPDGLSVPDPMSRFQPQDVHGPSEVIDPAAYRWNDAAWRGRSWEECVLCELHVGAFTLEGTFRAAAERLGELAEMGITAIELMPVADFPGARNWGYDGVLPFAPDSSYGRPEDLKAFVDAAHAQQITVLLDVVYNHFGPEGNYLPAYAPIFTQRHTTPWGPAVNYDAEGSSPVRELVISNAVYWISEYHLDGLRLDAVHTIVDDTDPHILDEIAAAAREAGRGRNIHLLLENEENEAWRLARDKRGMPIRYTAQWNDDVHHVLHAAATGESSGYYADYVGNTKLLGRALAEGFAFQGEFMAYRGSPRGQPSAALPPTAFVSFIQNHDQVGNRAFGERLTTIASLEALRAIAAVYLLGPQIPMIFMGEEWGAEQPFPFFCDFGTELTEAVREGRRAEFAKFPEFQDPMHRAQIPDPTAEETFHAAKLRWDDSTRNGHVAWRNWYRRILRVRHTQIIPRLRGIKGGAGTYDLLGPSAINVRWILGDGARLVLMANLKGDPETGHRPDDGMPLWQEGTSGTAGLGPWSVVWTLHSGDADAS